MKTDDCSAHALCDYPELDFRVDAAKRRMDSHIRTLEMYNYILRRAVYHDDANIDVDLLSSIVLNDLWDQIHAAGWEFTGFINYVPFTRLRDAKEQTEALRVLQYIAEDLQDEFRETLREYSAGEDKSWVPSRSRKERRKEWVEAEVKRLTALMENSGVAPEVYYDAANKRGQLLDSGVSPLYPLNRQVSYLQHEQDPVAG